MNTEIKAFFSMAISPLLYDDLCRALTIFELFGIPDYEVHFLEILSIADDLDPEGIQERVLIQVNDKLAFLLHAHKLTLNEQVPLHVKVELCETCYLLAGMDDYRPFLPILESFANDLDKVCAIISQVSTLTETDLFTVIANVEPEFLDGLKMLAYANELQLSENKRLTEGQMKIVKMLSQFRDFVNGIETIGMHLLDSGIEPGLPFELYLKFILNVTKTLSIENQIPQIFSGLLLTVEGNADTISLYRLYANEFSSDATTTSLLDSGIVRMAQAFGNYNAKLKLDGASK